MVDEETERRRLPPQRFGLDFSFFKRMWEGRAEKRLCRNRVRERMVGWVGDEYDYEVHDVQIR